MSVKIKDLVILSTMTLAGNNVLSTSDRGAAGGVASLDGSTLVPIAQIPTGTTGTTVSLGNHTHAGGGTNYQTVQDAGSAMTTRPVLNFDDTSLITFTATDNAGATRTDITATLVTNPTVAGNLTVTGNLIVNGTTQTVNSTTVTIDDPVFTIGGDTAPVADDNKDRGIEYRWHNGSVAKIGYFGFDDSTGFFTFIPDATNTSEVFSGTLGVIDATRITGSAASLTTARTINGTNFDGTGNITITANTTNALTIGTGLSGTSFNGSGAVTVALASAYGDTTNPYASKTANFILAAPSGSAGVPVFRAMTSVDVPTLNQSTTGSAATLTTARTIAITGRVTGTATSFDGSANISIATTALTPTETEITTALANGFGNVVSFTPGTISLTTSYASVTGIAGTALPTGTYEFQIKFTDSTNTIVYSGIMSWYGVADIGTTGNSEILMHQSGKTPGSAVLYARVLHDLTGTTTRFQVAGSTTMTMTSPTFRFRRIFD
jgi:hypothetical protein